MLWLFWQISGINPTFSTISVGLRTQQDPCIRNCANQAFQPDFRLTKSVFPTIKTTCHFLTEFWKYRLPPCGHILCLGCEIFPGFIIYLFIFRLVKNISKTSPEPGFRNLQFLVLRNIDKICWYYDMKLSKIEEKWCD